VAITVCNFGLFVLGNNSSQQYRYDRRPSQPASQPVMDQHFFKSVACREKYKLISEVVTISDEVFAIKNIWEEGKGYELIDYCSRCTGIEIETETEKNQEKKIGGWHLTSQQMAVQNMLDGTLREWSVLTSLLVNKSKFYTNIVARIWQRILKKTTNQCNKMV